MDAPTPARRGHAVEISTSSTATLVSRREQAALAKEVAADSADLLASLKEISLLFLTSPQFRLVINQAVSLFASIVADASGKVSEKAGELESKARETGDDVCSLLFFLFSFENDLTGRWTDSLLSASV